MPGATTTSEVLPVAGTTVTYHGTDTGYHGEWTTVGLCRCFDCLRLAVTTGPRPLRLALRRGYVKLVHVPPTSVTVTTP